MAPIIPYITECELCVCQQQVDKCSPFPLPSWPFPSSPSFSLHQSLSHPLGSQAQCLGTNFESSMPHKQYVLLALWRAGPHLS